MSKRRRNLRRSKEFYSHAVKILRHGFIDPEKGRRSGKLAEGFAAQDGYNLREFDDWTPAQKARITKMFNAVDELTARPYKVVRPRRKDRLKQLQKAAQHKKAPKGLVVGFVPVSDPDKPLTVKYKRKGVSFEQGNVSYTAIDIDAGALLDDPLGAAMDVVAGNPARIYTLQAGEYEIPKPLYTADEVGAEIIKRQEKYNADDFDPDDSNSSYWGNWLFGVRAYNYDARIDMKKFRQARKGARMDLKKNRKAQKRKIMKMVQKSRQRRNL